MSMAGLGTPQKITVDYAVLMTALASVVFVAPQFDSIGWAGIGLCGCAAIVVGIARVRPQRSAAWWALAASLIAMMLGDFVFGLVAQPDADPPPLANLCYLARSAAPSRARTAAPRVHRLPRRAEPRELDPQVPLRAFTASTWSPGGTACHAA
jgi:hypothetical protein